MAFLIVLASLIPAILAHSWMTCPPSFMNTNVGRGGVQDGLCDNNNAAGAYVTHVQAGDRLKVGWTSNNHASGYVRLALVRYGQHTDANAFKNNVMKFACYGHDTRPYKTTSGVDCKHPCDARGGCEYQSDQYNIHRYDTTIGIPTNLADGYYILQASMLLGSARKPYNSCAKLRITKGNPSFNCNSNKPILTYSCLKQQNNKLELKGTVIEAGTKRGDFCYKLNGEIGSVDENLRDVPINVECDPRLSCDNSVRKDQCEQIKSMKTILNANSHPIQANCRVYNTIPDPEPTCSDNIKNRDEVDVDCGGEFCNKCPEGPTFGGVFHSSVKQIHNLWDGIGGNFKINIAIIKNITVNHCWSLDLQYKVPVEIVKKTGNPWGNGMLVDRHTNFKIMRFRKINEWQTAPSGSTISISFEATNTEFNNAQKNGITGDALNEYRWTPEKLEFLTALFEVEEKKCEKVDPLW